MPKVSQDTEYDDSDYDFGMAEMGLRIEDALATAMWRFHNAALDRAAIIYTFARSSFEDSPGAHVIRVRQLSLIVDTVHEFCFHARRAIERAEQYKPGLIAKLKKTPLHIDKIKMDVPVHELSESVNLTTNSFWWILGRIIHSEETGVVHKRAETIFTNKRTGQHHSIWQPVAFHFLSDLDKPNSSHYIQLEPLANFYCGWISRQIQSALEARLRPP